MKTIFCFLLAVIGMIAPTQMFGQCLTTTETDEIFPQSFEVDFLITPPLLYEPGIFYATFLNGEEVPHLPYNDRKSRYFVWAPVRVNAGAIAGCGTIDTFWNQNQHLQTGCSWPLVSIYVDGHQTWGNFDARIMWWNNHNYSFFVDGVQQPAYQDSTMKYSLFTIDHPTVIKIRDNATGCVTEMTVYPFVDTWISADAIGCDTVELTANVEADDPGTLTYLWSNGERTETIRVVSGPTYRVTVSNPNGYEAVDDRYTYNIHEPDFYVWLDDENCQGITEVWNGMPPYTFEWRVDNVITGTDSIELVSSNTNYQVRVEDVCGNTAYYWFEVEDISHTEVLYKDSVYVERYTDQYWNVTNLRRDTMPNEWVMITGDSIGTIDSVYIQMRQRLEITITADCNTVTNVDTINTYMLDSIWIKSTAISRSFVTHECLERFVVRTIIYSDTTYLDTLIHKETTGLGEPDTFGSVMYSDSVTCLITDRPYRADLIVQVLTDHYSCGSVVRTDTTTAPPTTGYGVDSDTLKNQVLRYVIPISTGIADVFTGGLAPFPNPATNAVTIQTGLRNWMCEIMDMTGKKIFMEQVSDGTLQIDCSGFPNGLYLARITSEDGKTAIEKLVVQ